MGNGILPFIDEKIKYQDFFNNDDIMTDYFHRSHYIDINIGSWNKPYICYNETKVAA